MSSLWMMWSSETFKHCKKEWLDRENAKPPGPAKMEAHIINGMPDGIFAPQSKATRAQEAAVIYKLLTILGK